MISRIIHDFPEFRLTSWGNGAAYCLLNKYENRELFFQDDDALEISDEIDRLTENKPHLDYVDALAVIWNDYEHCAREVEL